MVAVAGDHAVARLQRVLDADRHGLLADIEVAEAADQAHAVELAGLLLEAADQQHLAVVAEQLLGRLGPLAALAADFADVLAAIRLSSSLCTASAVAPGRPRRQCSLHGFGYSAKRGQPSRRPAPSRASGLSARRDAG